jgi:hypothetical protein
LAPVIPNAPFQENDTPGMIDFPLIVITQQY